MAIVQGVPGLEVTIEVDNTALPEHRYDDDGPTNAEHEMYSASVTTYLEVPSGAEFSVRWLMKEPFDASRPTHADVNLDGNFLQSPLRECGDKDDIRGYKYNKVLSKENGASFTQTFRFSELETDDQPHPTEGLKHQLEGIGTITVYLYYVVSEQEAHNVDIPRLHLSQLGPIHETISQKGAPALGDVLTHQASLTALQAMYGSTQHNVECENEPFASYTFHYRSTHALKSLGVIPRTPSPSPSRSPTPEASPIRDPATMTREELIAEIGRIHQREEEHTRIKREHEDDGDGDVGEEILWVCTRPAKRRAFVVLDEVKREASDDGMDE